VNIFSSIGNQSKKTTNKQNFSLHFHLAKKSIGFAVGILLGAPKLSQE